MYKKLVILTLAVAFTATAWAQERVHVHLTSQWSQWDFPMIADSLDYADVSDDQLRVVRIETQVLDGTLADEAM